MTPHRWKGIKGIPWPVCTGCGLVRLKNAITEWAVKHGCDHAEHPGYPSAVKSLCADRGAPAASR
jgi:hypothetical protein